MLDKFNKINGIKFSKYFLLAMCVFFLLFFLYLIKFFLIQVVLAVVLAIFVYPLFKIILKITKNNRNIASLICCVIVLVLVLTPLVFLLNLLISQITDLYYNFGAKIEHIAKLFQRLDLQKLDATLSSYFGQTITFDWTKISEAILNFSSNNILNIINKSYKLTLGVIFNFLIIMFSFFYILRDGENLLKKMKEIIPISEEYKDKIVDRFYSMTNATIRGFLFIGILQGSLATLTLWAFGIPNWLVWGTIAIFFSLLPFVGNGFILVPTGLILILNGDVAQGVSLIIISVCVISIIDNVLRPRIIGEQTGMHDLLIFFSILGGLIRFGAPGLIIGPIITSIFLAIVQIYKIEFLSHQDEAD